MWTEQAFAPKPCSLENIRTVAERWRLVISTIKLKTVAQHTVLCKDRQMCQSGFASLNFRLIRLPSLIFGSQTWLFMGPKIWTMLNKSIFLVSQTSTLFEPNISLIRLFSLNIQLFKTSNNKSTKCTCK